MYTHTHKHTYSDNSQRQRLYRYVGDGGAGNVPIVARGEWNVDSGNEVQ